MRKNTVPFSAMLILVWTAAALLSACSQRLPLETAPLPFRQAEDAFRLGHYDRAVHGYRIFIDSGQEAALLPRAYFRLAKSEFKLGRYDECIKVIDELQRRYPNEEWRQVDELHGDAEWARGNEVSAVHFWEMAMRDAPRERGLLLRRRISDAIGQMKPESLKRVRTVLDDPDLRALADRALAGGPTAAPPTAAAAAAAAAATPAPVVAVAPGIPPEGGPPARVGVLLPLSGRYAAYGERSLKGIKLAIGDDGPELVVRDTQGEVQIARAAVDDLVADASVVAVLGPLRSKVAETIAPRAERAGLPMLVLAQNQGVLGRYVMQTAMTYERQADQIAEYAVRTGGLRRFGILYPRDGYGQGLARAFRDAVEKRGATIVGSLAYPSGAEEFSVEVLSVEKWVDDDGLEAVFIPDFAATAVVLGARLRSSRPSIVLLGSNGWHDPGRLGGADGSLDGSVFVDGFFMGSQRRSTQSFIAKYRAAQDGTPQILEAQAYDAAGLIAAALRAGARSREQIVQSMQSMGTVEGAAGRMVLNASGLQRELFLLRLSDGRISEIAGESLGGSSSVSFAPVPARADSAP